MMTPDAGLKSTPSTSKLSEEDAQPHDDDDDDCLQETTAFLLSRDMFCTSNEQLNIFTELIDRSIICRKFVDCLHLAEF